MRVTLRTLVTSLLCCAGLVVLAANPVCAYAEASALLGGSGGSPLESPLVVAEAQPLVGGEGVAQAEEARRSNPEAVAEREASRTEYEGLNTEQAAKLAAKVFPGVIDEPAGGPPQLPSGESITGYLTDDAAQVDLGDGKSGLVESTAPMAVERASGQRAPVNLSLSNDGSSFQPTTPVVGVSIPKRLNAGVALTGVGVSLTPVDGSGSPLGGSEGVLDGATVFYGETGRDSATVIKPTTAGFAADTMLLSVESPQQLYFRVGLPTGASLEQAKDGSGAVDVIEAGAVAAVILPPGAHDAAGTPVPVSMSLSGDTLVLSVDDSSRELLYPLEIDPEVKGEDPQLVAKGSERANWEFYTINGKKESSANFAKSEEGGILKTYGVHEYKEGEAAYWVYQTRGVSKIYEFEGETEGSNKEDRIESIVELQHEGGLTEEKELLSNETTGPVEYARKQLREPLCPKGKESCVSTSGNKENAVHFQQSVVNKPTSKYSFSDALDSGTVYISEPEIENAKKEKEKIHSATSENTTTPEFSFEVEKVKEERKNALYGSSNWLSEYDGAIQFIAKDPGIGVAKTLLEYENAGKWEVIPGSEHNYLENGLCKGVQCEPEQKEYWTLNKHLPNGEDKIRYRAEEAFGDATHETESLPTEGVATVKVDYSKPHSIFLGGLPYGNELSERQYKLKVEAADGEGTTVASSGIASIKLAVDGKEGALKHIGGTGECAKEKGECTASEEWEINGAELGAGHHAIVIVVKDRAGNEARREESISIRHSTPVALGPGSVDLESGDFSLGATDVSMGSGLTVGRAYSSRAAEQGAEGPLGPQWTLSVGSAESLVEMADGSLLLTSANGSQAIFAKPIAGVKCEPGAPFESPPGDSNLKLWCEENTQTKAREAYYLEDAADHTKDKFTLPEGGTKIWVPTIQTGAVPTDTVTYRYQTVQAATDVEYEPRADPRGSMAVGADGKLWFTVTPGGVNDITTWGQQTGENQGPTNEMTAITGGQSAENDLWFTEERESKVGKMSSGGPATEYQLPAGSDPRGITLGPEGYAWFAEWGTHKIGRITPTGELKEYEVGGSKTGEQLDPVAVAVGPEEDVWFAAEGVNGGKGCSCGKIGKITPGGVVSEYGWLPERIQPAHLTAGPDGEAAMWFTDRESDKIGKITTSGSVTISEAKGPVEGIVAGQGKEDDALWFADYSHAIGKITPTGAITEYQLPVGREPNAITLGPEDDIWFTGSAAGYDKPVVGVMTPSARTTEPVEALAPVPKGVSCSPGDMQAGCRALKFVYATKTPGDEEEEGDWGEYSGRLMKVLLEAYNPSSKKMEETAVAEYSYDGLGRLRAEWDPRVSPALKTIYGYSEEGLLTALTPPGQESWTFTYGSIAGDAGGGRLVKATRAPATTEVWNGQEHPTSTGRPVITGTPAVGVRLSASTGGWSGALTYAYQWEECGKEGKACAAIPGANNANYTPVADNVGHFLVVRVSATNGGGSKAVRSEATTAVTATSVTQSIDSANSLNAVSCIPSTTDCVVSDSKGNAYYATNVSTSATETWSAWSGPSGQSPSQAVACPTSSLCLLADGKESAGGRLYYATSLGGAFSEAYSPAYGVDAISCVSSSFCLDGQDDFGYFRYSTNPGSTSWTLEEAGEASMKGVFCLSTSFCAIADGAGRVHVATSTSQIESSSWKETDVDGSTALNGVACTATTSCVAVDGAGNVVNLTIESSGAAMASKQNIDGTNSLTAVTCTGGSTCVAVDNAGNVFASTNSGETWRKVYSLADKLTSVSCASTTLCVAADTTGDVTTFNPSIGIDTEGELRSPGPGITIDYNIPVQGGTAPYNMSETEIAKWGQKPEEAPVEATAIFPADSPQGWPASSYTRATIDYLDEDGRLVNTASPTTGKYGAISTTEYNEFNDVVRTLSPDNRATALEAGEANSAKTSKLLSTEYAYNEPECRRESDLKEKEAAEPGTRLCETWGPEHEVKYTPNGFKGQKESFARDHTVYIYEDAANGAPETETFDLVTETQNLAQLFNAEGKFEEEVESRKSTTSYSGQSALGWKLRAPTSTTAATEAEGAKLTTTTLYNKETGQITETRAPKGAGGESAHDKKIIYYSSEENKEGYEGCGKHPEWAGLVCETLPAKQPPETTGVPKLPETTTTYNMWDEPEAIVETFPKTATFAEETRTTKNEYDAAGRIKSSEETSTATTEATDKALPKVTYVYNEKTGILEKQSTTVGEKTKTIKSVYNTLGQLETYTDADGNVAKYKYGAPEKDGLLEEISDSSDEGGSNQKYSYSETTKQLTKLVDSAAGTFTASYDTEGKLSTVVYPDEMCANYTYNTVGETTHIEYTKAATCSEKEGVWFSETRVPSVRGETMSRTSTLAKEEYAYDTLGRLTEAKETPAGEYCKTRIYAYDEESNRTKLTTREPSSKNECATEGGTVQEHTYDEANRLTDSGITYDALGNTTKLPSGDAEGHALESTFYVDNAVATQTQNGVTNDYYLDPEGRVREAVTSAKKVISHYDSSGAAVAWTCEGAEKAETCESGGKWTRNIPGIDGTLTAVEKGTGATGETPILQLHDLEGDVVATIKDKTGEAKLESTYNSTEFGVPNAGKEPPKFAWLGADGVEKSLASGVITEGATSYVPQTGMALQSEAVIPPGLPEGSGGQAAAFVASPWNLQGAERVGAEAPGKEAGREKEAFEAACKATPGACEASTATSEYDPEGLASQNETLERASQLRKDAGNAELFKYFCALAGDVASICAGGFELYKAGLEGSAAALEECVSLIRSTKGVPYIKYAMCFINEWRTPSVPLIFTSISLPILASAEVCLFEQQRRGINYYNCEGKRGVSGPLWRDR